MFSMLWNRATFRPRCAHGPAASRTALVVLAAVVLVLGLAPSSSQACACGCGVFDVGTGSMFPGHAGGMIFLEEDFMDQNQNWSGRSSAPADDNEDRRIRTSFVTAGFRYMFNRSWGLAAEVPYWHRRFLTEDEEGGAVAAFTHGSLGDIRIKGIYTGFSPDMSSGITFGLKLPTGDSTYANFDPDTEIGSGSTDTLLGAYHLGTISASSGINWFVQGQWQQPVKSKTDYRPGSEVNAVVGAYYNGWQLRNSVRIAPVLQVHGSYRAHDGGLFGHPEDSGYTRAFITPGAEIDIARFSVYADVSIPVYTNASGNQLVAKQLYKLNFAYHL